MAKPVEVSDSDFDTEVLQADKPVLVDFWATWCGPCKMVGPIVEEIANEYEAKLKVAKVDVDKNAETARQFGIMSIPTLIVFNQGKAVERVVGYVPKATLLRTLKPFTGE